MKKPGVRVPHICPPLADVGIARRRDPAPPTLTP